jgi:catechol 2,3-dioxygenase-like lactoylglutathione lyase family enzyme
MNLQGLSHLTFVVRDLERAAAFFREGLGGREVYDSAERNFSLTREKFFLVGGVWIAVMEAGEGEPPVPRTYRHAAFRVEEEGLPAFEARLRKLGVEVRPARPRVEGEGRSLYFYDFDGHLFELHAGTLEERLARYAEAEPPGSGPERAEEPARGGAVPRAVPPKGGQG